MNTDFFRKMKLAVGTSAMVVNAPSNYPKVTTFDWKEDGKVNFLHLFVDSKTQFSISFPKATLSIDSDSLFWLSYPKANKKNVYDINRDILWDLVIPLGWHPVSLISVDEKWSAIRLKANEEGKLYIRPNKTKKES